MLTETGRVVAVDGRDIIVRVMRQSACDACGAKTTCGQNTFAKMLDNKCLDIRLENSLAAEEGDWVELGMPDGAITRLAFQVYILPLLSMLVMAGAGFAVSSVVGWPFNPDLLAFLFGVVGFAVCVSFSRKHLSATDAIDAPKLFRIIPESPGVGTKALHHSQG